MNNPKNIFLSSLERCKSLLPLFYMKNNFHTKVAKVQAGLLKKIDRCH